MQFPPTNWPGGRYSFLLAALVLMLAGDPLLVHYAAGRMALDVFSAIVLLSAVLALGNRRVALTIAAIIAGADLLATLAAWLLDSGAPLGDGPFATIRIIASIAFFTYMAGVVMMDVMRGSDVTFDSICAAACVYLMIGLTWAYIYLLIEHWSPASYAYSEALWESTNLENAHELFSIMTYFSFVTLTTLGYGDIAPVSGPARTACWLEAITGQLFLATYVAGLVGIHIARRRERKT